MGKIFPNNHKFFPKTVEDHFNNIEFFTASGKFILERAESYDLNTNSLVLLNAMNLELEAKALVKKINELIEEQKKNPVIPESENKKLPNLCASNWIETEIEFYNH